MAVDNKLWRHLPKWGKILIILLLFLSIIGNGFLTFREQLAVNNSELDKNLTYWIIISLVTIQIIVTFWILFFSPIDEHSLIAVRSFLYLELKFESNIALGDDYPTPRGSKKEDDNRPLLFAISLYLIDILNEDIDVQIRALAARYLGIIGEKRALPSLVKMLKNETNDLQLVACWALGKIGSRNATKPLCDLLLDSNTPILIIRGITKALKDIGDPQGKRSLNALLLKRNLPDIEKEYLLKAIGNL